MSKYFVSSERYFIFVRLDLKLVNVSRYSTNFERYFVSVEMQIPDDLVRLIVSGVV